MSSRLAEKHRRRDPGQMAGLHTHDDTGTIHNEGHAGATLDDASARLTSPTVAA